MDKEVRDLIRQLKRVPGVTVSRGSHPRVSLDGTFVVSLPGTPSDHRWYRNTLATLRRAGIVLGVDDKRPAGGQPPPPLPTIKEKVVTHDQKVRAAAHATMLDITNHFGLTVREGRVYGHGSAEYLAEVLMAYSRHAQEDIPARVYTAHPEYNTDLYKLAFLSAKRVSGIGVDHAKKREEPLTRLTTSDVEFAGRAWAWFLDENPEIQFGERSARGRKYVVTAGEPADLQVEQETGEAPPILVNGQVERASMQAVAGLVKGGMEVDEAIDLVMSLRDAA